MIRRFLLSLCLVSLCLSAAPVTARAFDPFGAGVCGTGGAPKASQSVPCHTGNSDPIGGNNGILIKVTNIVAYLGGGVAVIMIVAGAIKFITSGSDMSTGSRTDTDVEDARRMIINALVGLAVIILARTIITYVIRNL